MTINELKLGEIYDITIEKTEEKRKATISALRYESKQEWYEPVSHQVQILNRFESVLDSTTLVLDENGNLLGEMRDYKVVDIDFSESRIIKSLKIKESELNSKAEKEFGENAEKVIQFIKGL